MEREYEKRPNKGSIFLETAQRSASGFKDLVSDLAEEYNFNCQLTKYPFRLMEDDNKANYILKLIRQGKCNLSGLNRVILNAEPVIDADPTSRMKLQCNSLKDVFECSGPDNDIPLPIFN